MSEIWTTTQLETVADITMGQSPDSSAYNVDEVGLPFLQGCAEFGTRYPTPEIHCFPPLRIAKRDSILISVRAPVGQMNWSDQEYCIGRGLGSIKARAGIANTNFLRHALEQNIQFLHRRSQGSTFLAVGANDLKLFPILDISETKQERIASILDTIDQAIEKTEALIHKYQQIKAGLMHDLFTRGLTADGKLRPPREQAPELYQETPIGWIPKEWVFTICSKVCENIIDCKNRTPPITPEGFPVIRTPNVRNGEFVDKELVFTDYNSYLIWTARGKPRVGDIVITREAPVGEVCMIPGRHHEACLGQRMMLYRPAVEVIDPTYFLYALQSHAVQNRLDLISGGSTVGHVRVGDIRDLWIYYPNSPDEQKKIGASLSNISKKIESERAHKQKLTYQKSGLMHDLLTGKVPVTAHPEEATHGS